MNPLTRLKRAVESWAIPTEEPLKTGKAVVSSIEVDSGKRPIFTFRELSEAYEGCDIIQTAVQQLASEIVGMGFKTEMNESYNIKLNGKTAKDVIDDWNQKNNLDEFMSIWGIELISMGNSFCIPTNDGLVPIPIKSIWKTIPVDKTTPMFLKYHLELTGSYDNRVIKDFVHFKINQDSNSMPLGRGIIEKLLNTRTHDVPSLLEVDEKIRKAMLFGFERQGWGEQLWDIPELSAEDLSKFDEDIKDIRKGKAKRIVTNAKGATVTSATLDRSRSFDEWLVQIENRLVMALGDPMLKSTIIGNFSEASIKGVTALHKSIIRQYQQVLKRGVEKLWRQVLIDAVFDPDEAQVKLVFNEDSTEVVQSKEPVNKPVPEVKSTQEPIIPIKESLKEDWITKNGAHVLIGDDGSTGDKSTTSKTTEPKKYTSTKEREKIHRMGDSLKSSDARDSEIVKNRGLITEDIARDDDDDLRHGIPTSYIYQTDDEINAKLQGMGWTNQQIQDHQMTNLNDPDEVLPEHTKFQLDELQAQRRVMRARKIKIDYGGL